MACRAVVAAATASGNSHERIVESERVTGVKNNGRWNLFLHDGYEGIWKYWAPKALVQLLSSKRPYSDVVVAWKELKVNPEVYSFFRVAPSLCWKLS